jgi:WD40 repeat protein/tetratricopeptide (TPR) repeat protein
MATVPSVPELVSRWQELQRQGQSVSPEDLCAACPERLEEVKRHLRALGAMEPFRGQGAGEETATLPPAPPGGDAQATTQTPLAAESKAVPAGVTVPGHEILGELGRGGMGVVYRARQTRLNRLVALKMILSGAHAGDDDRRRFLAEAEAVARLQHPNIVQIHEIGEADGNPFFSLEFCPGGSLAAKLAGTPLPPQEAARLVGVLARAVQAAHEAGVVHRDLKPANVLLLADGTPKITDFGLAKKLDGAAGQTASGAVLGTPSYMAPEQAGGKTREVGPAADVYALGAILYECLTGRPPFRAATPLDTVLQVLSEEPVPPSRLLPGLPRDLETVCLKCLHKDPARRYASAAALADDMRRFQGGEPIQARPVGALERGWRWCRRNRAVAASLAAVAAALLLGTAVATHFAIQSAGNEARALEQSDRAGASARQAADRERDARQALADLEAEKEQTTGLLYATRVSLAHREWQAANLQRARQLLEECPPALRGWEWDFLKGLFDERSLTLNGHAAPVLGIALTPDGNRAVTFAGDQTVRFWDAHTGVELARFNEKGHRLALSPDGRRAAVALDGAVKVFDLATGRERAAARLGDTPCGLGFVRDGKELAVATLGGEVLVLDPATGAERSRLGRRLTFDSAGRQLLALGQGVVFSPDGRRLAQGGGDCKVRVWDAATGKALLDEPGHLRLVGQVAFSPDGRRLASPGGEGDVRVWDLDHKQVALHLRGNGVALLGVAFSPDGRRLAACSKDMTVRVWDAATGEALPALRGHAASVMGVAFGGDGRVASAGADGTARIWDGDERVVRPDYARAMLRRQNVADPARRGSQEALTIRTLPVPVSSIAFSPDGRLVASATIGDDAPHQVTVWELTGRRELHRLAVTRNRLYRLAFSPDGRRLAVGIGGGGTNDPAELAVFDVATGRRAWHWTGPLCVELRPAFAPDGGRLAATLGANQGDNFLVSWQTSDGRELFRQPLAAPHQRASYSPDGQTLVTAVAVTGLVEVFDAGTGRPLRQWSASPTGQLTDVVCGPGGLVATADLRPVIKLWDLADGRERAALEGHAGVVMSLAFSPDGRRLLSGGNDLTARLWGTASGRELLTFRDLSDVVSAVAWSPDGSRLGAACGDGIVKVWTAAAAAAPPRTDDWQSVFRDDFAADGPPAHWKPQNDSPWEVRDGVLRGRQVNRTYLGATFPSASATLPGVELPRTVEVRFAYRAARPLVMGTSLVGPDGQRIYSALLCGGGRPFGEPCAKLQQLTVGMNPNYLGVSRPFRTEPGQWRRVRLLREPDRIRVYEEDAEVLAERIPDVELPFLMLQASWGAVGDEIEFNDLEIRAPADAVREQALRKKVRDVFAKVLLRDEVRRRLEAEGGLTPADRSLVERLTAGLTEDPDRLEKASREASVKANGRAEDYELARKQAEAARQADPDNPTYLGTLARAQYRTGRFAEAIATMRKSLEGTRADHGAGYPYQYAILAMAYHRLGQDDAAREQLGHVRDLLLSDTWSSRPLARAALAGAEATLGDAAKPENADEAAIKRLVARSDQDGWQRHDLAGFLAAYADDVRVRTGRGEEPGPYDLRWDRRQLEEVRGLDFQGAVLRTDITSSYEDMRVRVRGDEAELRCRAVAEFGTDSYLAFGVHCRLRRTAQGWRIHEYHSWPLAERQGSRRTVKDAAAWAALDAAVERLAKSSDRNARIQALRDASRPAEAYDLARRLTDDRPKDAAAWALRGDLAHDVGQVADALASFRRALACDPDAELPWYMTRRRLTFQGHGGTVFGVAWHPDGRRLFSAGADKLGRLWEAATGREVRPFPGSTDILHNAALSADGRRAAAGSTAVARIWDVETGRQVAECRGHEGTIYRLAFSPDGSRLVTAGADHTARVWDAATGRPQLVLRGHTDEVLGAAFSPDGKHLATASHDRTAKLWDAATGALVRTFEGHTGVLKRVVFSPDGKTLATTGGDKTIRLWDVSTGRTVRTLPGDGNLIEVVLFSPDGRLASADVGGRVRVWDAETGAKRLLLRGHEGPVFALAFRPDGRALASAGRDGVLLWDVGPGPEAANLR